MENQCCVDKAFKLVFTLQSNKNAVFFIYFIMNMLTAVFGINCKLRKGMEIFSLKHLSENTSDFLNDLFRGCTIKEKTQFWGLKTFLKNLHGFFERFSNPLSLSLCSWTQNGLKTQFVAMTATDISPMAS